MASTYIIHGTAALRYQQVGNSGNNIVRFPEQHPQSAHNTASGACKLIAGALMEPRSYQGYNFSTFAEKDGRLKPVLAAVIPAALTLLFIVAPVLL